MPKKPWAGVKHPNRVIISEKDFQTLQQIGKVRLQLGDRSKLESVLFRYIYFGSIYMGNLDSSKMEVARKRIVRCVSTLIKDIDSAKADTPQTELGYVIQDIFWRMEGPGGTKARRDRFVEQLRGFETACETTGIAIKRTTPKSKPGTKQRTALNDCIEELAILYESAGGRATANYQPTKNQIGSPFSRFAYYLLMLCPREYQPHSEPALAERIKFVMKDKRKG